MKANVYAWKGEGETTAKLLLVWEEQCIKCSQLLKLVGTDWSLLSSPSYIYTNVSHLLARKFKAKLMC